MMAMSLVHGVNTGVRLVGQVLKAKAGNFALASAVVFPVIILLTGGVVEVTGALHERQAIQHSLDSGVLAATRHKVPADQELTVQQFLAGNYFSQPNAVDAVQRKLDVGSDASGHLTAHFTGEYNLAPFRKLGLPPFQLSVTSTAAVAVDGVSPCLMVLANTGQALLQNSQSRLTGKDCEVDVKSVQNPAYVTNSKAEMKVGHYCVEGTRFINNGGITSILELNCRTPADPYRDKLPVPTVSATCKTSGPLQGTKITIQPGVHCDTTFNGNPEITFAAGLHIIKGTMTINSGARISGTGVTFYFPDVNSKIQFNGTVKLEISAPTSGAYQGLLLYENPTYSASKTSLVFNSFDGEALEGIVYLPNRDVTYNSRSNCSNKVSMVVNTLIINDADWKMEPYPNKYTGSSSGSLPRLMN